MRLNGPRSSGLLVSMVFALALSLSAAPSITVDHIDGLDASGGIYPGTDLKSSELPFMKASCLNA